MTNLEVLALVTIELASESVKDGGRENAVVTAEVRKSISVLDIHSFEDEVGDVLAGVVDTINFRSEHVNSGLGIAAPIENSN